MSHRGTLQIREKLTVAGIPALSSSHQATNASVFNGDGTVEPVRDVITPVQRAIRCVVLCAMASLLTGCRMGVPIHVWQPPEIASTVGQRVAVSRIAGPSEFAEPITATLIATMPRDAGRETSLVAASSLQNKTQIQLVSATDDQTNDLALASVARREGIQYVLRGEILENRHDRVADVGDESLSLSWRLTSLSENRSVGGKPVFVDVKSAIDRYPDLGLISNSNSILATAAARDAFRLITPWIDRERVQLAIPYLLVGSEEVRRGNIAALSGRWAEAEEIWSEVAREHPSQNAAIHNLSLAAAAGQDFSRAKQLARKAIRRRPTRMNKNTLVWIETKQREYHQAFNLPDPPEGWFVTGQ